MRLTNYRCMAALLALGFSAGALQAQARAAGGVCQLEISGNDALQFDKQQLQAGGGCKEVTVTLRHVGKLPATAMGHNWVLARPADADAVATDGISAGVGNGYLKPKDPRVIASTTIVGGGESVSVTFSTASLKKGESYTYMCTFPGHSMIMRGTFTIR